MAYIPVSTSRVVWTNDLLLGTPPRRGNITIGAMTSTMPNAHTTQPMMNNARCDSTSITPVSTRGLIGKQATHRTVMSVLHSMVCQFLNDELLLI